MAPSRASPESTRCAPTAPRTAECGRCLHRWDRQVSQCEIALPSCWTRTTASRFSEPQSASLVTMLLMTNCSTLSRVVLACGMTVRPWRSNTLSIHSNPSTRRTFWTGSASPPCGSGIRAAGSVLSSYFRTGISPSSSGLRFFSVGSSGTAMESPTGNTCKFVLMRLLELGLDPLHILNGEGLAVKVNSGRTGAMPVNPAQAQLGLHIRLRVHDGDAVADAVGHAPRHALHDHPQPLVVDLVGDVRLNDGDCL